MHANSPSAPAKVSMRFFRLKVEAWHTKSLRRNWVTVHLRLCQQKRLPVMYTAAILPNSTNKTPLACLLTCLARDYVVSFSILVKIKSCQCLDYSASLHVFQNTSHFSFGSLAQCSQSFQRSIFCRYRFRFGWIDSSIQWQVMQLIQKGGLI